MTTSTWHSGCVGGMVAFSPFCRFAPGLFAIWLFRPLADSLPVPGLFSLLLIRPLTLYDSPLLNKGNSTSRFIGYVIFFFRPRQFMYADENKRLCECLMLCSIMK